MAGTDFSSRFTGGAFLAAALMLWFGSVLMPVRVGVFFEPGVFNDIHEHFHLWIWTYRIHLFGLITAVLALVAFAAMVADSPARVMIWPGAAVATAGFVVTALAEAFYYHHGAWGSIDLAGKPPEAAEAFVASLRVDTEYLTCLTRFGRVFGGLGLVVFSGGTLRWKLLPAWNGGLAALIGLAAMTLTMVWPDHMNAYRPVFHLLTFWLLATGLLIVRHGLPPRATNAPGPRHD
jgi:hypothetical protein